MPDRVKVNGVYVDASSAPPWYEHFVPGGLRHRKTMKIARMNARRNAGGNSVEDAILWIIAGLFVVALVWFLVAL